VTEGPAVDPELGPPDLPVPDPPVAELSVADPPVAELSEAELSTELSVADPTELSVADPSAELSAVDPPPELSVAAAGAELSVAESPVVEPLSDPVLAWLTAAGAADPAVPLLPQPASSKAAAATRALSAVLRFIDHPFSAARSMNGPLTPPTRTVSGRFRTRTAR